MYKGQSHCYQMSFNLKRIYQGLNINECVYAETEALFIISSCYSDGNLNILSLFYVLVSFSGKKVTLLMLTELMLLKKLVFLWLLGGLCYFASRPPA